MQSAWQIWSCHHAGKFPRNHCFVLGERIERHLYDLLETLLRAKYTRSGQPFMRHTTLRPWELLLPESSLRVFRPSWCP